MGSLSTRKVLQSQPWLSLLKCTKCSSYNSIIRPVFNVHSFHQLNSFSQHRKYSSKTTVKSSLLPATAPNSTSVEVEQAPPPAAECVPAFSGYDIREADPEIRMKVHNKSSEVAKAQGASQLANTRPRRRKEILIMDESEYVGQATGFLVNRPPLLDRRGEAQSFFFRSLAPENTNHTDILCTVQADIDLRPEAIRKWKARRILQNQIDLQKYNPKRNRILGSDLAAAHVVVARGGKVKFMGHKTWITEYRKDAKPGVPEEDLPVMKFELCTLPVNFDPRYRLEAIDASDVEIHYEGLENFDNLHYVKFLSFRNCKYIDDWCIDRISRQLSESLEFIDLSGCKKVTDKGIGALHRCSKLKAIRVENMGHLENLEIVSAMLEDYNPNVQVIGTNYEEKIEQLRLEGEELEEKAKQLEASKKVLSFPVHEEETDKAADRNVQNTSTIVSQ